MKISVVIYNLLLGMTMAWAADENVTTFWSSWQAWTACSSTCAAGSQTRGRICMIGQVGGTCPGLPVETRDCSSSPCPETTFWGSWQAWTTCSNTCAGGVQTRRRICMVGQDGETCPGLPVETRDCSAMTTFWGSWTAWSSCGHTCEAAFQSRRRICIIGPNGGGCPGLDIEIRDCSSSPCPVTTFWGSWTAWSSCGHTCEAAFQSRRRICIIGPNGGGCPGLDIEIRDCSSSPCPVDGNWSQWGQWSSCSKTCRTGTRNRTRACDNPPPENGGAQCPGLDTDSMECNTQPCPGDGNWGQWGQWSSCSKTCGTGTRNRTRACDDPSPASSGAQCPGPDTDSMECNTQLCPVNGNWGQWEQWSSCSKTCGTGARNRTRACDDPSPANGGAQCPGNDTDSMECNTQLCPVDGNWGQWDQWSSCSKTCGTGTRNRTRACDDPLPANGGAQCPGPDTDSMECNTQLCPVDGNWGQWDQWSSCSKTCGTGTRNRTRACDDPLPANGGAQCPGPDTDSMECNTQLCPVDGNWGQWGQWSSCTKTCGIGTRNRTRACDNPSPANGGAQCPGPDTDSMECDPLS